MVDIPLPQDPITTAEAPQTKVSSFVTARAGESISRGLDSIGSGLDAVATPLAKEAGTQAGQQLVTRNADGTVNIATPGNSFIMGQEGQAYDKAMTDAAQIGVRTSVETDMANLRQQADGNPQKFLTAAGQYSDQFRANHPGQLGQDGWSYAQQVGAQHYDGMVDAKGKLDTATAFGALKDRRALLENQLDGLASQGGTGTPQFQQAMQEHDAIGKSMAANPLFPYNADLKKVDDDQLDTRLKMSGAAGDARRLFQQTGNLSAAQQTFDKEIAALPVPEKEKLQYSGQITSHLLGINAVDQQRVQGLKDQAGSIIKIMRGNGIVDDNQVETTARQLETSKGGMAAAAELRGQATYTKLAPAINNGTAQDSTDTLRSIYQHATGTSPAANPSVALSPTDRDLMIRTIAGEAGGESDQGQAGVAHVIKTRSISGNYGQGVSGVIQSPRQFSVWNAGDPAGDLARNLQPGSPQYEKIGKVVDGVMSGAIPDPTGGADHYYNPGSANPAWGPGLAARNDVTIGNHRFVGGTGNSQDASREAFKTIVGEAQKNYDEHAQRLWDGMKTAFDSKEGFVPTPAEFADLKTMSPMISDEKLSAEIQQRMQVESVKDQWGKMPLAAQQDGLAAGNLLAQQGGVDNVGRKVLGDLQTDVQHRVALLSDPVTYGQRYIPQAAAAGLAPVQPLDLTNPAGFAAGLKVRQDWKTAAQKADPQVGNTPLTQVDRQQLADTLPQANGQQAGMILGGLTQNLRPDELSAVVSDKGIKNAITGLTRSADPGKMNAAFSFMDTLARRNPMEFDAQFHDGVKDLSVWQGLLSQLPPDEVTKRMLRASDPAQAGALAESKKVADEALKTVTAANVVSKFSTGFGPFGTGARAPVNSSDAVSAAGALRADYASAYREAFASSGDPHVADTAAVNALKIKYSVSPVNGNRVMAYAPESYYPDVDGSKDWIGKQLDQTISGTLSSKVMRGDSAGDAEARAEYRAPRALISDATTQADIAAHKPPSYGAVIQQPNGQFAALSDLDGKPLRIRFDPAPFQHDLATAMEAKRNAPAPNFMAGGAPTPGL